MGKLLSWEGLKGTTYLTLKELSKLKVPVDIFLLVKVVEYNINPTFMHLKFVFEG